LCPTGKFASSSGAFACTDCPAGFWSGATGANSSAACLRCPAGRYSSSTGATSDEACSECPAGTYSSSQGASSASQCTRCPAGTFSDEYGAVSSAVCRGCPAGKFASSKGATACTDCPAGTFSNAVGANSSSVCVPCAAGRYATATGGDSDEACSECPAGTFSSSKGASSAAQCSRCPAGYFSDAFGATSAAVCSPCPKGTYNTVPGQPFSGCRLCPPGTYSNESAAVSADACAPCPAGSASALPGAERCDVCLAGTISSARGSTACALCPAGSTTLTPGSTLCTPCPAGSAGSGSCGVCRPGTFAEAPGQTLCESCPRGHFQPLGNSSDCLECPAGRVASMLGSTACDACEPGWHAPSPKLFACTLCPAGTYSASKETVTCTPCPAGTSTVAPGAVSLTQCEAGRSSCPEGQAMDLETGTCVPLVCGGGLRAIDGGCVGCGAGYFGRPLGNGSESESEAGGAKNCTACPAGLWCPGGMSAPVRPADAADAAGLIAIPGRAEPQVPLTPPVPSSVVLVSFVGVAAATVLVALLAPRCFRGAPNLFKVLDVFTLNHFVPVGKALVRKRTFLGGVLTIAMVLVVLGLAIDTLLSFLTNNVNANTSLVSAERAPVDDVHGAAVFQLAVAATRDLDAACPNPETAFSLPSNAWTVSAFGAPGAQGAQGAEGNGSLVCRYLVECSGCRLTQKSSIACTLPYDFQSGAWAAAATPAFLSVEPQEAPTIVAGAWGGSGERMVASLEVELVATAEVRVRDAEVAHGYLLSLESSTQSPSGVNAASPFIPSANPVEVSWAVSPSANALVTELVPRLTAVEATSILVGAMGGVASLFAFFNNGCEQVSRALVQVSGDARLNFAETDTSDLTNIAQHPSMLTMKPRILHSSTHLHAGAPAHIRTSINPISGSKI